ncbi:ABC transporter ATP-binding protein [Nocardioides sp. Root151]|uniref:ABC transporter ATP-binding protein n=1 Tax=Nocardioides sp. Root151 TaxID=1736475 RepID=UPI0009E7260B|nr:ABC transporter ATP-binding protein [Nocardioides sp. Root151]
MPLLEIDAVGRTYGGVHAVQNVSFNVKAGEWVGVIGPNGAGKSTLFNILGGQVKASSGHVRLAGRDVTRLAPHRRYRAGISRSFQISSLFPDLTVREHLTLACRQNHRWSMVRGWRGDRVLAARVDELLDTWDLGRNDGVELPANMSYGAQRRLELAIAVSAQPSLLLLDEPNVGLTASECGDLRDRVAELGPETAVIFVAHDMDMVMGWSHRILVMHQGQLVADDTPEAIARNAFVEEVYLGAEPIVA